MYVRELIDVRSCHWTSAYLQIADLRYLEQSLILDVTTDVALRNITVGFGHSSPGYLSFPATEAPEGSTGSRPTPARNESLHCVSEAAPSTTYSKEGKGPFTTPQPLWMSSTQKTRMTTERLFTPILVLEQNAVSWRPGLSHQ